MDFAKLVIQGLKKNGWSAAELARRTDLTDRAIQFYVTGEREPSLSNANDVLAALGMSVTIGAKE